MNVLAFDLGTNTGYAYSRDGQFTAGSWKLGTSKEIAVWGKQRLTRRNDPRIERLCDKITVLGRFDLIVFEDVAFSSSTYQVQLWSSFRSTVWLCGLSDRYDCVPVKTLKKFATDDGNADKVAMSCALVLQHPELWKPEYDDDAVDAIWVWLWAKHNLGRTMI